jgi:hypothetical protein
MKKAGEISAPNTNTTNDELLWRRPSSGMWRRVDLVWTDVSEERIAYIFRAQKSASEEPAWAGGCRHLPVVIEILCQAFHLRRLPLLLPENKAAIAAAKDADLQGDLTHKRALRSDFGVLFFALLFLTSKTSGLSHKSTNCELRNRPCKCVVLHLR